MYVPKDFEELDPAALHALMHANPLATLVQIVDGAISANHVPLLLDAERGVLIGHVARANPLWKHPGDTLAIFHGADAYITPSWYASKQRDGEVVPTWNYAVVHAHGRLRAIEDRDALRDIVTRQTDTQEGARRAPWHVTDAPAAFVEVLLRTIVGIEIEITRLLGKSKLSQNRDAADRAGVVAGLTAEGHPMAHLLRER